MTAPAPGAIWDEDTGAPVRRTEIVYDDDGNFRGYAAFENLYDSLEDVLAVPDGDVLAWNLAHLDPEGDPALSIRLSEGDGPIWEIHCQGRAIGLLELRIREDGHPELIGVPIAWQDGPGFRMGPGVNFTTFGASGSVKRDVRTGRSVR